METKKVDLGKNLPDRKQLNRLIKHCNEVKELCRVESEILAHKRSLVGDTEPIDDLEEEK